SGLGLSEEVVELSAGGVEGSLLVLPTVMDQWAAVLVDNTADQLLGGDLSQRGVIVCVADDLSAEHPYIVDMVLDGSFRQPLFRQVKQEGHEEFDKSTTDGKVLFLTHPTLRPFPKIATIAAVGQ
ncbi:MAG: hypothetical protein ACREIC_29960, partial [Limisphaerales bacterium]